MHVLVKSKTGFGVVELTQVSSIAFANHTYTIVNNGTTTTYSDENSSIHIIYT